MSVSHQLYLFFDQASNDCSSRLAGPIRCAHLIIMRYYIKSIRRGLQLTSLTFT